MAKNNRLPPRRAMLARVALGASLAATLPPVADAQTEQHPDSADFRAAAEAAQDRFERLRSARLPETFTRSGIGCSEQIGRFCHWPDDEEWSPPPEHQQITDGRDSLLAALDSIADAIPGDGWITGLRVHYRLERGDGEGALTAAAECRADRWWCGLLTGYALHHTGQFSSAEEAFAGAFSAMPYGRRCDWSNLEIALDRDLREEYRAMRCSQRQEIHDAVWDMADPLYLREGNDRYTEHVARLVAVEIMRDARTPFEDPWREDVTEIVVRFGWPIGWEKNLAPRGTGITSRGRSFAMSFMPPAGVLLADSGASWTIDRERAPTAYLPSYLNRITELEHQIAMFRRGDSAVVAGAYRVPDAMLDSDPVEAALTLVRPGEYRLQTYNPDAGPENSFRAVAVDSSLIVSLEAYSAADSLAARARYPVERPRIMSGGIGISDVLLFRPREPLPESVDEAVFLAHHTTTVRANEPLGLYWEVYGLLDADEGVATEVTVIREGRGLLRGLFETVGLARPRRPEVRFEWSDGGETTTVYPRAVVVDLNDSEAGNYTIRVAATPPGGDPVISERSIRIIQDD